MFYCIFFYSKSVVFYYLFCRRKKYRVKSQFEICRGGGRKKRPSPPPLTKFFQTHFILLYWLSIVVADDFRLFLHIGTFFPLFVLFWAKYCLLKITKVQIWPKFMIYTFKIDFRPEMADFIIPPRFGFLQCHSL